MFVTIKIQRLIANLKYENLPFFSQLIKSYLAQNEEVKTFSGLFPTLENFKLQIELKSSQPIDRKRLVQVLKNQYTTLQDTSLSLINIEKLKNSNTFTVTTGHQLNLFTGPIYFIYKIVSTIQLARKLSEYYPDYQFIPIYWMASEDHDFEEINHFNISENQKFQWNKVSNGAVGKQKTEGLDAVFQEFSKIIGEDKYATELKNLFQTAYVDTNTLSEATRILVHTLFGKYGLIILDPDDFTLKQSFIPYFQKEINEQILFQEVSQTNVQFQKNKFEIQVNPRPINLFYLTDNSRERVLQEGESYRINNINLSFSKTEMEEELTKHPHRFSPNVLLRPVYQEMILPNLATIGGGGEISYWLQLKTAFERFQIVFPILVVRNSVLWVSEKQDKKWQKLGLSTTDYLSNLSQITNKIIAKNEPINKPNFEEIKNKMQALIAPIAQWTSQVEPTYVPGIHATLHKQETDWHNWEQKLTKSLKKKNIEEIQRAEKIIQELFPNTILQERYINFSSFYLKMGNPFLEHLLNTFDPFSFEWLVFKMEEDKKNDVS